MATFEMLKFTTLPHDTPDHVAGATEAASGGEHLTNPHLPAHVTRTGRFLRKTSLNELRQLLSVLRGDTSIVGPRPIVPDHARLFGDVLEERCSVMPGLTGLTQTKGRKDIPIDEFIACDLQYVRSRSFWLDVKILLATPLAVLTGRGAV